MFDKCIKVLWVEDSQGYTRLIMELLNEEGTDRFELEWVGRLDQALKRLAEEAFDVVLLDLGLPDGQGLEVLSRMCAQAQGVSVIVLTGSADEDVGVKAIQLGAQDYLLKGQVDSNLLARAMRYAIERQRAEGKLREAMTELERSNKELEQFAYVGPPTTCRSRCAWWSVICSFWNGATKAVSIRAPTTLSPTLWVGQTACRG